MAVLVVVELRPVDGRLAGVARLLERQLPVARLHVDDVDVLVAAAVEVAHQLVLADVVAEGELPLRRRGHAPHGVVGQADEPVLLDPVDGEVAEAPVRLLLHLLLRLQPRVLVVPQDEVHLLLFRGLGRGRRRRGFGLRRRIRRSLAGLRRVGPGLRLLERADAEHQGRQVFRPRRAAGRADGHALGEGLVRRRVVHRALRPATRPEVPEADGRVDLVRVPLVVGALQHGEAVALLGPREALVRGLVAVEHGDDARRHVPELHAVAGLVGRVDDERQVAVPTCRRRIPRRCRC